MAENSHISWTTHTFNTHWGCTKVSDGCQHCYADTLSHRYGHEVWGPTADRKPMSEAYWNQLAKWERQAAASGTRPRVFCNSMSDLFEGPWTCQNEEAYRIVCQSRARLFDEILRCPHLDFLLLTKRPDNMTLFAPLEWEDGWPENVWAGTSVENQNAADKRIPHLLRVPAAVRFLSCEPVLGPVSLMRWLRETPWQRAGGPDECAHGYAGGIPCRRCGDSLHWVIVGGESGHGARPMHPDWARRLRDECQAAGVAYHFKQWGEWLPAEFVPCRGFVYQTADGSAPDAVRVTRRTEGRHIVFTPNQEGHAVDRFLVGKKAAGRTLDGRTWGEFPQIVAAMGAGLCTR